MSDNRTIDVDWPWQGDSDTPGRWLHQLADALWRHQMAENFATLDALTVACMAVAGHKDAQHDLDTCDAWKVQA